jgi:hypothetical protein
MPPCWILCRCVKCATFSHTDNQGESISGREWNKNSVTFREHQTEISLSSAALNQENERSSKTEVSCEPPAEASQFHQDFVELPHLNPVALDSTSISEKVLTLDPNHILWKGTTVDCGKLFFQS